MTLISLPPSHFLSISLLLMTAMKVVLILTVAIYSYVGSESVPESTEDYFCKEETQVLKSEHASTATECEQTWTAESIPIGSFMSGAVECQSPCINVTAGEIVISTCMNVTLTVICYKTHVTEYRTHFLGIQRNRKYLQTFTKRDHYGIWACLSLLLVLVGVFIIQHCLCQHHKLRPI